ncbi:MAG: conserved rane protein of unknown function [Clostridia bacterium]|jgi:signal transduction histidine kinase|nr:conserved rane protein of unknown function [Clostridia bacterium]
MSKDLQFGNITKWLKLFTHFSATVLLITNNSFEKLKYLIPLVLLLFLINYSRDYYLASGKRPIQYVWLSLLAETALIISIGFFGETDVNTLYFYVFISETVIIYPFIFAVSPAVIFIVSEFLIYGWRNGIGGLIETIVPMLYSYAVSTAFVMGMSYLVKLQVRERQKLARINLELEEAYKKLIENSATAQKLTVEQERTRMAREIHDTLAHTLTNLIVQLEACKKLAAMDPSRLPPELEKAQELSRSGFHDIKRTIKALRPQAMEDKSFFASITSMIKDTMENTKVDIKLNNMLPKDIMLSSQIEVAIFRVIQEGITNSIRHGKASEIEILIKQGNRLIELCIVDNGIGCTNIKKGFGIQGMMERIESINGSVAYSSSYGNGFEIKISIPYEGA